MNSNLLNYVLQLADNGLIYGHRLSEWCGHGPILEVDMALSNIALDSIGAARSFYQYAASIEGNGKTEDSYPYLREVTDFKNALILELPNGSFADTIARSFFFDAFQFHFYTALCHSTDKQIAGIAEKSLKEVTYHLRFSSEWVIRLGDGTEESKQKIQAAIENIWTYPGELFEPSVEEKTLMLEGIAPDITLLKSSWNDTLARTLEEATLQFPISKADAWHHSGGKKGIHTEYLGFILAEMQHLQRVYPGCEW